MKALRGSCGACKFGNQDVEGIPENTVICQRYPSQAVIIMIPRQNPISRQVSIEPSVQFVFPQLTPNNWCGEFQSKVMVQ